MRLRKAGIILLFLSFFSEACIEIKNEEALSNKPYFDLEAFIDEQVEALEALSEQGKAPTVSRQISIGDKKENIEISNAELDSYPDWVKELLLFKEADINKPVLLKAYEEINTDSGIVYKGLSPGLKVQEMAISYEKGKVFSITLKLNEENYLYASNKDMYIQFKNGLVSKYSINGYRKLVTNKPLDYFVVTDLSYPADK